MWGRCNFGGGLRGVLRVLRHGKVRHKRGVLCALRHGKLRHMSRDKP